VSNNATVQEIYEAFGRGDVETILGHIAEDCAWESWADNSAQNAGLTNMLARTGTEGVREFFQVLGSTYDIRDFQVLDIIGDGRQVAVESQIEFVNPSGNTVRDEELLLWAFDDQGKVCRLRHYVDTAKHLAAHE